MSNKLSVYEQLIVSPSQCLSAINREIGTKTNCTPFAVKVIESLKTLSIKTEQDALNCANALMSGLQTLWQGGIVAEDYDKLDFVNRGNVIVPSARVEAFYRAAARKGYRITDTIVAVPKEDASTTYFKENFYNGDIIYTLEDKRNNTDREVTAQRLIDRYFKKIICRLDIYDISKNQRVAMVCAEMTIDELITIASASEQGLYYSYWEEYTNNYGKPKKRKIVTNKINNKDVFWVKWTSEMVNKTIIRRALKRVKETLPELTEAIYAFEQDDPPEEESKNIVADIEIPVKENVPDIDIKHLTDEQKSDAEEMCDLFVANPKLAEIKANEIINRFKNGETRQDIVNDEYAAVTALWRSKQWREKLGGYFNEKSEN